MVDEGILDATLLYPTGGEEAIRLAANILNHRPFKKENILQTTVIDERNVRIIKLQSDKILKEQVIEKKKPILGICLGMQLLATKGYEDGESDGLDFIQGEVLKMDVQDLRIPHIGWNEVIHNSNQYLDGIKDYNFYFVHVDYFVLTVDKYSQTQQLRGASQLNAHKIILMVVLFLAQKPRRRYLDYLTRVS